MSSEEGATPTNQKERPEETSYIPSIAPFSYFGRSDLNCLIGTHTYKSKISIDTAWQGSLFHSILSEESHAVSRHVFKEMRSTASASLR